MNLLLALIVASLFALAVVALFSYALFTMAGRQDEADEIAVRAEGESDGN